MNRLWQDSVSQASGHRAQLSLLLGSLGAAVAGWAARKMEEDWRPSVRLALRLLARALH